MLLLLPTILLARGVSLLLLASTALRPFDHSAAIRHPRHAQLVRWDALHFRSPSPRREQDWAFARAIALQKHCPPLPASILAALASTAATLILFRLTLQLSRSPRHATLVALLHAFAPAPATQVVPYTEPFYALFSFAALDLHHRRPSAGLPVALLAAAATALRPLGTLQALIWLPDALLHLARFRAAPLSPTSVARLAKHALRILALALITAAPFLYDQYAAYTLFCRHPAPADNRPWCANPIPSIYLFVQAHYWNNGFLNYWTWNQAPLFLLSLPVYWASFGGIWAYYRHFLAIRGQPRSKAEGAHPTERPFLSPHIHIHVLIQLILTTTLLLCSHVQIILRQAATIPAFWWGLADGIQRHWDHPHSPHNYWRLWLPWIVVWTPISLLLWAGFYPPA
ncbi:hypothetical protein PTTG_04578 [Puccinia triticina 1-1 BBBD Race 1]|uniref:GPI mannosyltransferase 2 n=2 Tax=Puccinia triticina TaxID=208348 RepID=A0A180H2W0_PUCT1|nr:uncharacterized protein PtA15_8A611 [Puccinia triticina]OAV99346.1 hypothetical protein PTTG_04578 [Puccinia triticina 1-1 BBBD Race 1]WAQ87705.1 hypothetical protein PtA15_8A611 [Puccinia triticina]WAR57586.1 hypothetical protein PtB15_8B638 [Puccinia triticina]